MQQRSHAERRGGRSAKRVEKLEILLSVLCEPLSQSEHIPLLRINDEVKSSIDESFSNLLA